MSVIVRGMEMPKSCSKCGWFDMGGGDGYRCTLLRKSFDMWNKISVARDKNCPLINIPTPHGRLIDADKFEFEMNDKLLIALTEKYGEKEAQSGLHFSFRDCICNIQYQPTVIEAEGSKDE